MKWILALIFIALTACGDINYSETDSTTVDDGSYSTEPVNQKGEAE